MRFGWMALPVMGALSCLPGSFGDELSERELVGPPREFFGDDSSVRGQELAKISMFGHADTVTVMAMAKDAKRAVTGSMDHTVRWWDLLKGKEIACFSGHTLPVTAVAIAGGTNELIASGSQDLTVRLWSPSLGDTQDGVVLSGHQASIRTIVFSKDGTRLLSGDSNGEMIEWSLKDHKPLRRLQTGQKSVNHIIVDEVRKRFITSGDDQTVKIWDEATEAPLFSLQGHNGWVMRAALSPDGNFLATSSSDQSVRLWNLQTQSLVASWPVEGPDVTLLEFGRNGRILAAGIASTDSHTIRLWDVFTGQVLRNFVGHSGSVLAGVFIGDTGLMTGAIDETARLWSLPAF